MAAAKEKSGPLIELKPAGAGGSPAWLSAVAIAAAAAVGFAGGWLARRPQHSREWTTQSGAHLALAVSGPKGNAVLWDGSPLAPGSRLQPLATFPAAGFAALLVEEEGGTVSLLQPGAGALAPGGALAVTEGGPSALGGSLELGDKPIRIVLVHAADAFSAGKLLASLRNGSPAPAGSAVIAVPVKTQRGAR